MKKTIIMLSLALVSWGAVAQHDHSAHEKQKQNTKAITPVFKDNATGKAYAYYIQLKDALVASESDAVKKASAELVKSLQGVTDNEKVRKEAEKIASATTLDAQRKTFTSLSNEMVKLVKKKEISSGEVYLEYCPMANNNSGGYWLSNEKEIKNPYFGNKMLKCGSVKETIN